MSESNQNENSMNLFELETNLKCVQVKQSDGIQNDHRVIDDHVGFFVECDDSVTLSNDGIDRISIIIGFVNKNSVE